MTTTARQPVPLAARRGWGGELSAALNGVYTMWLRDVIRFSRDRSRLASSLSQPILFLFIFGAGLSPAMGQLGQAGDAPAGLGYIQFMFPGIITMAVLFTAVFSAISVVWDREFGFLKEVLVAPVPRWAVAVGKALGGSTTAMLQGAIILLLGPFAGINLTPLTIITLLPAMFLTAFAMCSLGLVIAARMRSMEGFQMVLNFLMMPMFFLSGALFPLTNLPDWLMILTRINPITYGVDAIRQIVLLQSGVAPEAVGQVSLDLFGRPLEPLLDLGLVVAFAALMIVLAVRAFSLQE